MKKKEYISPRISEKLIDEEPLMAISPDGNAVETSEYSEGDASEARSKGGLWDFSGSEY